MCKSWFILYISAVRLLPFRPRRESRPGWGGSACCDLWVGTVSVFCEPTLSVVSLFSWLFELISRYSLRSLVSEQTRLQTLAVKKFKKTYRQFLIVLHLIQFQSNMYLPRLLSPLSAFGDVSLLVVFPPTHESYSSGEKKISKLLNKSSLNAKYIL